jgi:acetyltransferase
VEKTAAPDAKCGLDSLFAPRSIAVVGATERAGTVGRAILWNLLHGSYQAKVYAVNPNHPEVLGNKTYKRVAEIPETVDLAVVATPAWSVPQIIGECVDAGVKSAIVISAGFREQGAKGAALEDRIQEQLRRGDMRLLGPNCLGIMNPALGLNVTFANESPRAGNVAFLSQSGALLTAILDWSQRAEVGFSGIVSTGSMLDVGWGDLIDYFGDDPHTKSILIYMESVGHARSFLSAARAATLNKPIIVIKAGRSDAAARAAASHTGALTGSDEVLDAAFRRSGVLRVHSIADLFYMAEALSKQPRPKGPHLTILTNAGGPGVLATDALLANNGELTKLSPETLRALDEFLPLHWSHSNPIDILGDGDADRYAKAVEIATKDPNSEGLLVILAPQGMADPGEVAEHLRVYGENSGKPLLASWMGGASVASGEAVLDAAGIPTFPYPDTAARVFTYMWRYTCNLRGLYETPALPGEAGMNVTAWAQVEDILSRVRDQPRTLLDEYESKQVLAHYGIPVVATRIARTAEEAAGCAAEVGYPAVLKVFSHTITHKTDVGGVQLNLRNAAEVRSAYQAIQSAVTDKAGPEGFSGVTVQPMVQTDGYELILGSSADPQFGPVIMFGSGGQLVEVYRDRALALPPLNTTLAQRLMEQTRIFAALKGIRGRKPVDLRKLETLLVRFSQLVVEHPWIAEIDINPLLASPQGLLALDARIVLHSTTTKPEELPKPAIRPYPAQYVSSWSLKDGTQITIRPIRPEDEPLMVQFHSTLSERSVYLRYFSSMTLRSRVEHERLVRICFGDYDREMALVAEYTDPKTGQQAILGVGRLIKLRGRNEAEVAVLVSDEWQRRGIGMELLQRAIAVARAENVARVSGELLRDNLGMQTLLKKTGFRFGPIDDAVSVRATLEL